MSDDRLDYIGLERRRISGALKIEDLNLHIEERIKHHLEVNREKELAAIDAKFADLKSCFMSAFPDDDPRMHREYHLEQIRYMKEQREFYADLKKKGAFALLVFFAGLIGTAAWEMIKRKLGVPV